jgi:hypothetical protein
MGKNGWAGREGGTSSENAKKDQMEAGHSLRSENITFFLAGDVMTGKGDRSGGKRSQDTESFRDQAGLRMTYMLRHPARSLRSAPLTCENLRHPATAYKTGIIQVVQLRPVISYIRCCPTRPIR